MRPSKQRKQRKNIEREHAAASGMFRATTVVILMFAAAIIASFTV